MTKSFMVVITLSYTGRNMHSDIMVKCYV
jgi:hypothetical protein